MSSNRQPPRREREPPRRDPPKRESPDITKEQEQGGFIGGVAGMGGGALTGLAAGAPFGPGGMAVGAILGAAGGTYAGMELGIGMEKK